VAVADAVADEVRVVVRVGSGLLLLGDDEAETEDEAVDEELGDAVNVAGKTYGATAIPRNCCLPVSGAPSCIATPPVTGIFIIRELVTKKSVASSGDSTWPCVSTPEAAKRPKLVK
jgi:hypothetical protein